MRYAVFVDRHGIELGPAVLFESYALLMGAWEDLISFSKEEKVRLTVIASDKYVLEDICRDPAMTILNYT